MEELETLKLQNEELKKEIKNHEEQYNLVTGAFKQIFLQNHQLYQDNIKYKNFIKKYKKLKNKKLQNLQKKNKIDLVDDDPILKLEDNEIDEKEIEEPKEIFCFYCNENLTETKDNFVKICEVCDKEICLECDSFLSLHGYMKDTNICPCHKGKQDQFKKMILNRKSCQ